MRYLKTFESFAQTGEEEDVVYYTVVHQDEDVGKVPYLKISTDKGDYYTKLKSDNTFNHYDEGEQ